MDKQLYDNAKQLMNFILEERYTDLEQEKIHAESLLELADREKDTYCMAYAYTYLGDYYIATNDHLKCTFYLHKAEYLCSQNAYHDLLLRIYNLYAICYEAVSDEQTAFQYYLKALPLAKEQHDDAYECILYNNIASDFGLCLNYEEADKYYEFSCAIISEKNPSFSNSDYIPLRVFINAAEICIKLNKLEQAKNYIQVCESFDNNVEELKPLLISKSWCQYYVQLKDYDNADLQANVFLNLLENSSCSDMYLLHELILSACSSMISSRNQEYAQLLLNRISLLAKKDIPAERVQQNQKIITQYYEAFGTSEECQKAYYDFYQIMNQADNIQRQTKANGLKNIIGLNEVRNSLIQETHNLDQQAHLDELTQLYNRRYFNKLTTKYLTDSSVSSFGFLMLDVDYFKEYNDTYGHANGDNVLKSIGHILKSCAPSSIFPCRYGGDEFCCLCVDIAEFDIIDYIRSAQEHLAHLAIPHRASHCSISVTMSIGYTFYDSNHRLSANDALSEADQALYASKAGGRNQFTKYKLCN